MFKKYETFVRRYIYIYILAIQLKIETLFNRPFPTGMRYMYTYIYIYFLISRPEPWKIPNVYRHFQNNDTYARISISKIERQQFARDRLAVSIYSTTETRNVWFLRVTLTLARPFPIVSVENVWTTRRDFFNSRRWNVYVPVYTRLITFVIS